MIDYQQDYTLKQIVEDKKIKQTKLKEFHLEFDDIDTFVEVSDIPNPASYKHMPTLVANDGTTFRFKEEANDESTLMLSSSSSIESSDKSILSETDNNISTLQTTQPEYILSSSQSILRSDDF